MIPGPHLFDCGCLLTSAIVDGTRTMTLSPCRPGCRVVEMALAEADAQGRPVEYRSR